MKQHPSPQRPQHLFIGAVKWFDNIKGFGILALPLDEELFVHLKGFKTKPIGDIKAHDVIIGEKIPDRKKDGYIANKCCIAVGSADWIAVLSLLGSRDQVKLPGKLPSESKQKRIYKLTELAAAQLFKDKQEEELFLLAVSYLDSHADQSFFLEYVALLEKTLTTYLEKNAATDLLSRIFDHFGAHVTSEILFSVWKAQKFRYIGYQEDGDYEIPENILNLHATEIGPDELRRIQHYSFGTSFCSNLASAMMDDTDSISAEEMEKLLPYLEFLSEEEKGQWKDRQE